jgi:multiple sugar transport system substrate-binding protein
MRAPISINPGQPIPLYFQLKTLLLEAMIRGEYGPGDRLPTEHELCRQYGLSRTPVHRALSELATEGVILRHRRRGTFVNPHWARRRGSELRVVVPAEGPWESLVRKTAPDDLTINVVTVPRSDLHRALTLAVAEGQAPDLAVLDSVWMPEFAAAGFLHAIDDLDPEWIRREFETDFLPPLVEANRYGGRTYAVSTVADVAGVWFRRQAFESAGVEPATTWAELRAVAQAISASGVRHPLAMPAGSRGAETTSYCLLAFLASNGVEVLTADGVLLAERRTVEGLRFLRRLVTDGLLPADAVSYEWDRSVRLLAKGQAAMSFGGSYEARALARELGVGINELDEHVGFTTMPRGPHGAPAALIGTMVCGIFRQAPYPDLAMRLLRHLVAPEAVAAIGIATGRIPPRRSAVAIAGPRMPFLKATAEMLDRAVSRPATPVYPRVSQQVQAMLEAVLTGRLTPARAAHRAAELIGAITGLSVGRGAEPVGDRVGTQSQLAALKRR